jgi:hypothetical protein
VCHADPERSPARWLRRPAKPARCRARADVRSARVLECIHPDERETWPLPIRAKSCEPGLREGQGPRRRRAQRAQASSPSTRARAEQAGGGQQDWSQGINRYSYVFNDPINQTDPSGFISSSDFAGFAFAAPFVGAMLSVVPGGGALGATVAAGAGTHTGLGLFGATPGGAQAGVAPASVATGQVQGGSPAIADPSGAGAARGKSAPSPEQNWKQALDNAHWYSSERLAADTFLDQWNPPSIRNDQEFSTIIVKRGNKFAALGVVPGEQDTSFGLESYLDSFQRSGPLDTRVTAWVHTHSRWGSNLSGYFGKGDVVFTNENRIAGYLGTPQGRFKVLLPGGPVGNVPGTDLGSLPPNSLYAVP